MPTIPEPRQIIRLSKLSPDEIKRFSPEQQKQAQADEDFMRAIENGDVETVTNARRKPADLNLYDECVRRGVFFFSLPKEEEKKKIAYTHLYLHSLIYY